MQDFTLVAEKRSLFGKKLNSARKAGKLPAILYGQGVENIPLFLDERAFRDILTKAGLNTIVKLEVSDPVRKSHDTRNILIHDVTYDPVNTVPVHADLYQVRMDKAVRVEVPFVFHGEAPAVKVSGGVLIKAMHGMEVEALPGNLPHEIGVDISCLETFEDTMYVRDLLIPPGVTVLVDADTPIASVAPPRSEEELKALEEAPAAEEAPQSEVAGESGKAAETPLAESNP